MKILCVIDSLGSGGAQRQLVNISLGLKEKGHNVAFLIYHKKSLFFKDLLDEANISIFVVTETSYFKRLLKMRKIIRKGGFDAVLSFLEAPNFICELAGLPYRNWKLVVGERSSNPNIQKLWRLKFYRWFHTLSNYVVANSHENLRIVRKVNPLIPLRKCKVIYNMIDFTIWKPVEKYELYKNGKVNIVIAASHQYLKNAKGLIEAVKSLNKKEQLQFKIDWYGDKSPDNSFYEAEHLINSYSLQNIFSLNKATKNIIQKMQNADVIALCSWHEGLPNTICEGMALGKPVIASNVSDLSNFLPKEFLFDPFNYKDIARVLLNVLSLSQKEFSEISATNRSMALKLFDKDTIIDSYNKLLTP